MDTNDELHPIPPGEGILLDPNPRKGPDLVPLGPWVFLWRALPRSINRSLMLLLGAWAALQALPAALWAWHLGRLTGASALPSYWGEQLSARDLWELTVNGGLQSRPVGPWVSLSLILLLGWVLWAGWRVQTEVAGLQARFAPWAWGFLDALLVGALPLWLLWLGISRTLKTGASSGIQVLGWADLILRPWIALTLVSAFFLQWWLLRLGRAGQEHLGPGRGLGLEGYLRHLVRGFLRLWLSAVQWAVLLGVGSLIRFSLGFGALWLAWRSGGGTPGRVWTFLGLQVLASILGAWFMAWILRISGLFWRHDARVRAEVRSLERG